ncbi:MAG: hypothetical protein DSY50_08720 [Desulfobulbus sp.]|nr:MAG: hypothetical protein DSY50_08720 [Desulfobulbus sp.]
MEELKKQRRHIRDLMRYAVPDEHMEAAGDLLILFRDDRLALTVLEEFYSFLPEAREDWIKEFRVVARKKGVVLLAAVTSDEAYLYLVSSEGVEFHGSLSEGYLDQQLLRFFKLPDSKSFIELSRDITRFPVYQAVRVDPDICPACHAATGETHELGCPVEICPWCGGQLIYCSCRFDKLGLEILESEQDLIRFEKLLEQQGRIAYAPEQKPGYADDGPGIEQH